MDPLIVRFEISLAEPLQRALMLLIDRIGVLPAPSEAAKLPPEVPAEARVRPNAGAAPAPPEAAKLPPAVTAEARAMLEPVAGRARPEEVAKIGEAWTQGVPLREIGVFFGVNPDDRSALKRIQNIAYRGKFQRPEGFLARIRFGRAGSEKIQNAAVPAALAPSVGIGATPSAAPREQPAAPPPAPAVAAPSSEPHMVTHDQARHWGSTHGIITPRLDLDLINAKRVRIGMPVFGIVQSARLAR